MFFSVEFVKIFRDLAWESVDGTDLWDYHTDDIDQALFDLVGRPATSAACFDPVFNKCIVAFGVVVSTPLRVRFCSKAS